MGRGGTPLERRGRGIYALLLTHLVKFPRLVKFHISDNKENGQNVAFVKRKEVFTETKEFYVSTVLKRLCPLHSKTTFALVLKDHILQILNNDIQSKLFKPLQQYLSSTPQLYYTRTYLTNNVNRPNLAYSCFTAKNILTVLLTVFGR